MHHTFKCPLVWTLLHSEILYLRVGEVGRNFWAASWQSDDFKSEPDRVSWLPCCLSRNSSPAPHANLATLHTARHWTLLATVAGPYDAGAGLPHCPLRDPQAHPYGWDDSLKSSWKLRGYMHSPSYSSKFASKQSNPYSAPAQLILSFGAQ